MTAIDLEVYDDYEAMHDGSRPRRVKAHHKPKQSKWAVASSMFQPDDSGKNELLFAPSVNATSSEMGWITEHLAQFYHSKLISDVTRRVKGGKEANVYSCTGHPESGHDLIAAKLYRPRQFRSLKNANDYAYGRALLTADGSPVDPRDWRLKKAVAGKSRKGLETVQTSWLMYEFTLLQTLHWAGADVPEPLKHNEYALMMEYVGDETMPAPLLIDVTLEPGEARQLFDRMVWNIDVMLRGGCVHGDLSAYNVLYWDGRLSIIDFPQVVDPQSNPAARQMFLRDVERVCGYFGRYGVRADARRLARDLWKKNVAAREVLE